MLETETIPSPIFFKSKFSNLFLIVSILVLEDTGFSVLI
jgi:hypothetical protein